MTRRLLVPLDGSQAGGAALPWAVTLARGRNATLALVRAVPLPPVVSGGPYGELRSAEMYDEILAEERAAATENLDAVRDRLAADGLAVEPHVRVGPAGTVILDLADALGAETIVMATHGRGGLTRVVLGSVADQIVQQATLPIMLVHADGTTVPREPAFDRLLVPLDGSALAERALDLAGDLAGPGAMVVVVRVAEPRHPAGAPARAARAGHDDERVSHAYLERVAAALVEKGLRARVTVRRGVPAEQLLAAAREHDVDLIAMVTHGRTGPARWWLGSVADAVVRRSDRPVLLVSARTLVTRASEPNTVGDVMTRDVTSVREDEPLIVAVRKILRARVGGLPVLGPTGPLVGIVSATRLADWHGRVTAELARQEGPDPHEYGRRLRSTRIAEIMGRPAPVIDKSASLGQAVRLFRERAVGRIPVTRDGQLSGIVTLTDVVKAMAARYEAAQGVENPTD